ncbi:CDP-diacylglycerol--glycerol-3-phosphate 3-phosphatidyltransferase [Olsenella sp. Marseille-P4559]|jgi:CDP-diacylglycerol--glycerol-3-phosphate 3-phosphatidyltransferase|uniref:CDP-diacylglycerol--glycerol-3-phosphate 3-phosphatidyltransferase n=1 Tax=Olsenella sp. Marseille-P4559 TaxID=2364795 RepID=UPI00102FC2A6|nr:CDP-diacylglycerol--glycerol-3-phosphate 3-phosphatidyltransferase [Olsenella sp. Marseille-P4559]
MGTPAPAENGGGKSSLWTPANVVTCVRVVAVPLWLLVAELSSVAGAGSAWSIGVFVFFVALSLTDKLDGYLARSRDEVTTFGKFLDPIADKLVVVVALCFLLERGEVSSWVLLVIVAREFLVSGLRMVVASAGTVIAASPLGKGKTAVTMVAISALLLVMALPAGGASDALWLLGQGLMLAAVILTAWSGIDYFVKAWSYVVGKR